MTETQTFALVGEPPVRLPAADVKALVRHRDGYCCTVCGMTAADHFKEHGRNLDVHRALPGSPYTIAGCVTLCQPCHHKVHHPTRQPRRATKIESGLFQRVLTVAAWKGLNVAEYLSQIARGPADRDFAKMQREKAGSDPAP